MIGDGHSGLGATTHQWDPDVAAVIQRVTSRFRAVTANSYVCHPFCGWERRSVDFWGPGGRGDSLERDLSVEILRFVRRLNAGPLIRHHILGHTIWTSFGGYSRWPADDHSGRLRHLHVTYHPVPPLR